MKTAICQFNIAYEQKQHNLTRAERFISNAAAENADIIFFPEMSFTGFSMNTQLTAENDGFTERAVSEMAQKHNIAIAFGQTLLVNGKAENHYTVIDKKGKQISDYTKIHSFSIGGERESFHKGNVLSRFSFCSHYISTFICYDLRFPEIFRAAADTSTVMTVAANWPKTRIDAWTALLKARAVENQVYIIGINCVGNQDGLEYIGGSTVIDPWGKILYIAQEGKEELFFCEIENNVNDIRNLFPVLADRRGDLYDRL